MFYTNFLLSMPGGSEWLIVIVGFVIVIALISAIVYAKGKK